MISVIITCYNEGEELRRAVESIRRQTYKDYEIIVVKDYNDDEETLRVCHELETEGIRVLYSKVNVGVSVTRNMGIAVAKGDVVHTVDADDELPENALEIIVETFSKHPEADVVFGNYELIENESHKIVDCSCIVDDTNSMRIDKFFLCGVLIGQNAIRKEIAIEYPYSEHYSFGCQDYELQLRLLEAGIRFVYTPHVIYQWYRKPTGINSSRSNAESLDECNYEHRNFISQYIGKKYMLGLLEKNDNRLEYKQFYRQYAPIWCRWATILPFTILTKFSRFVK